MGEVVDFKKAKIESKPHYSGACICLECKHQWTGVWPYEAGMFGLECPSCSANKGTIAGLCSPDTEAVVFTCMECVAKCQIFHIIANGGGVVCLYCGYHHSADVL